MSKKETKNDFWNYLGSVKASPAKYETIKSLGDGIKIPSEIAKETGMRTTQVSNALNDMKKKNIVYCLNEEARKGRLYKNTELGLDILEYLK